MDRPGGRAPAGILSAVSGEIDDLRTRVTELERQMRVLFEQTGAADWEGDALATPPVSEELRGG